VFAELLSISVLVFCIKIKYNQSVTMQVLVKAFAITLLCRIAAALPSGKNYYRLLVKDGSSR